MNNRLKKVLSYGAQFFIFAPFMGFLVLVVFAALGMMFFNGNISMSYMNLINLILVLFGSLLLAYLVFGLPAFFTGMVFGYCCHKPHSSLISGGFGALFSFMFALLVVSLLSGYFGLGGFLAEFSGSVLIALAFAVLAFIFGALLAFLFKEKRDSERVMID